MRLCSHLFVTAVAAVLATSTITSAQRVNNDRVVEFDTCYQEMQRNDANGDLKLTDSEYFDFSKRFGGRSECWEEVAELPIELRSAFNQIACECLQRGGAPDCCQGSNANVPIIGSAPGDNQVVDEQLFLQQACLRTDQAIISFCGPPPPPVVPIGPAVIIPPAGGLSRGALIGIILGALLLLLLLLLCCCCCGRRYCFAVKKGDDDSSSSSSSSSSDSDDGEAGARNIQQEEGGEPMDEEAQMPVPPPPVPVPPPEPMPDEEEDGNKRGMRGEDIEEDDGAVGKRWNRTIEGGDPEEDGRRGLGEYEIMEPEEDDAGMQLRHVELPPAEPEPEEPYELEHYDPDGGIIDPQREGEWQYNADGGWTPEERAEKDPVVFAPKKYEREIKEEPVPVDNRKQRQIGGFGDVEVFDKLDAEDSTPHSSQQPDDMFDWVIRSTLNTLDQTGEDNLKASIHSKRGGADDDDDGGKPPAPLL